MLLRYPVSLVAVGFLIASATAQEDFSGELPRIPPTAPADALAGFHVAEGFRIEQIACEPLVTSPVAIEWDADGRLYVCEMRGYSEDRDDAISRITLLDDVDDDGVYDTSTVFVDGLLWPTALFPFDGGLFVGDAPNLYYFKDTDGDDKADIQQVVLTGFGTSNVQGLMNSFRWGLDNRIHIACSSVGGNIHRPRRNEKAVNVRGRDLAFDPRSFEFRLTSGAAQHGMCFDDWGRKFVSSNSDHLQQVMYEDHYIARNPLLRAPPARLSIAADGPQAEVFRSSPVEPWRIVRTRLRVSGQVPGPVEGGGRAAGYFTGATGATIYRGDAWPDSWKGLAIVGDVGSNLIHRKRLEPNGIAFIARRIDAQSEFVSSSDIWFRPAQFANAPDGTLHVIDVCREVIEHPKSLPPDIKRHLDLTSGRDRGRIYRIVPDGYTHRKTPRLSTTSTPQLVETLEHPNAWHRETASRLLFERQDGSAAILLRELADTSNSAMARLHAIHALDGLGQLDEGTLLARLADSHPQVRRHAIRLAEGLPASNRLTERLVTMVADTSIEVRYQLAFTIGSVRSKDRIDVLAELVRRDPGDPWMQTAVQSSVAEGAGELFALLVHQPRFRSPAAGEFLRELASQIAAQRTPSDLRLALQSAPRLAATDAAFALPVIGRLLKSRSRAGTPTDDPDLSRQLAELDQIATTMVRRSLQVAADPSVDAPKRVAAINASSFGKFDEVAAHLVSLISNRQPDQIQRAAVTTLGTFNSPGVAPPLIDAWRGMSPQLRETTAEVLFARVERTLALFDAIDSARISVSDLARSRLQTASKSKHPDVRSRSAGYLDTAGSKLRQDVVEAYRDSLKLVGRFDRGKILFRKHCSGCHKVEGVGHELGPNLATIKTRGPETILVNVLDPNREVNPQYLNYVALTEDGRTMTGMIAAESATSITLRRAESETDTVLRVDIDRLQSTGLSIMPEGLEETIDQQSMADIIQYLMKAG